MKQQFFETSAARRAVGVVGLHGRFPHRAGDEVPQDESEWLSGWRKQAGLDRRTEILRIGSSVVDRRTRQVETPAGKARLRLKELELLMHLFQHATVTFTREELLQAVWNYQSHLLTRTVDQTVATLRKKVEVEPERPRLIQTVHGVGYRLVL